MAVRNAPILGEITTTTTIHSLARAQRTEDGLILLDRPCSVDVSSDRSVRLEFDDATMRKMPPALIEWKPAGDAVVAGPWKAGWGEQDIDEDGLPGIRVHVTAPVCGGWMDVATDTGVTGAGVLTLTDISGTLSTLIDRDVLKVGNPCLGLLPRHSDEHTTGRFRYAPVGADATCEALEAAGWPVHVDSSTTDAQGE